VLPRDGQGRFGRQPVRRSGRQRCQELSCQGTFYPGIDVGILAEPLPVLVLQKVLVMFEGHRIEFIPKTGAAIPTGNPQQPIDVKSLYVVKYNGQVLADALTPEKRTTIPPNSPQDKQEVADIMLVKPESTGNKDVIIALISRVTGIKVLFDGSSVTVLVRSKPFQLCFLIDLLSFFLLCSHRPSGKTAWSDFVEHTTLSHGVTSFCPT
jgi:hypothetical protein